MYDISAVINTELVASPHSKVLLWAAYAPIRVTVPQCSDQCRFVSVERQKKWFFSYKVILLDKNGVNKQKIVHCSLGI